MRPLSNTMLLELWESGRGASPIERALLLLAAADPQRDRAALADISIPRRDAEVLALRCHVLGSTLPGFVDCPRCGKRLEFDFDAGTLLEPATPATSDPIRIGERCFRLPETGDLMAVSAIADARHATRQLVQRCCLDASGGDEWTDESLAQADAGLSAYAGAADTRFHFDCEACGHAWDAHFDICAYVWEELDARAQVLLDDVHRLALAYGWDEQQILALSDARRDAYLARCDQ